MNMKNFVRFFLAVILLAHAVILSAKEREDVTIPRYSATGEKIADLKVVIFSPNKEKFRPPYKVVLFTHGGMTDVNFAISKESIDSQRYSAFFTDQGYVFVALMRQGYGGSTGRRMSEDEKRCYREPHANVAEEGALDLDAGLSFIKSDTRFKESGALPLQGKGIILSGHSEGGFLALHLGYKHQDAIKGVLAFAPGLAICPLVQADVTCTNCVYKSEASYLEEEYWAKLGLSTVPARIIYASNDPKFPKVRRDWIRGAYSKSRRNDFVTLERIWLGNAHYLYDHTSKWEEVAKEFLLRVNP